MIRRLPCMQVRTGISTQSYGNFGLRRAPRPRGVTGSHKRCSNGERASRHGSRTSHGAAQERAVAGVRLAGHAPRAPSRGASAWLMGSPGFCRRGACRDAAYSDADIAQHSCEVGRLVTGEPGGRIGLVEGLDGIVGDSAALLVMVASTTRRSSGDMCRWTSLRWSSLRMALVTEAGWTMRRGKTQGNLGYHLWWPSRKWREPPLGTHQKCPYGVYFLLIKSPVASAWL